MIRPTPVSLFYGINTPKGSFTNASPLDHGIVLKDSRYPLTVSASANISFSCVGLPNREYFFLIFSLPGGWTHLSGIISLRGCSTGYDWKRPKPLHHHSFRPFNMNLSSIAVQYGVVPLLPSLIFLSIISSIAVILIDPESESQLPNCFWLQQELHGWHSNCVWQVVASE